MKRIILATAVALTLTACATNQDAYYNAIAAREARQAEQELRADTAIAQMASSGDAQAKGMAIMHFAIKAQNAKQSAPIAAPKSAAEQFLPWAALIVPSITQFYSITKNAEIAINSSNNALAGKINDNDMIVDLVKGREPIIGGEGDVLLYPVAE
jgi:protein involved in sex pheromone biosynthesis